MKGGHAEVVKFLLSQGAKVSAFLGTYNSLMLLSWYFKVMEYQLNNFVGAKA